MTSNGSDASTSSLLLFSTSSSSSSSSSPLSNVSDEERRRYLEQLQEGITVQLLPVLIFLFIIAIIGLFGNIMVLLVYSRKPRQNATDVYFMAIAVFDLMTNVLTIPGDIHHIFHQWDYENPTQCGFLGFCVTYTTVTSVLTLLAVAVCRYKKICRQFKRQTSIKTARIVCAVIALVSCVIATPNAIIAGLLTIPTPRPGIYGQHCSIDDAYVNTKWPMIHASFQMLCIFIICGSIMFFYCLISRQAWRYGQIHASLMAAKIPTTHAVQLHDIDNGDSKNSGRGKSKLGFLGKRFKYTITPDDSKSEGSQPGSETMEMEMEGKSVIDDKARQMTNEDDSGYSSMPTEDKCDINLPTTHEPRVDRATKIDDNRINTNDGNLGDPGTKSTSNEAVNKKDSDHEKSSEHETEHVGSTTDDSGCPKKGSLPRNNSQERSMRRKLTDTLTRAKKASIENETSVQSEDSDGDSSSYIVSAARVGGETSNRKGKRSDLSEHGLISERKTKRHRGKVFTKATIMSIAISVTLVIAFLPYVTIHLCIFSSPTIFTNMSPAGNCLLQLFIRFFLINSATNAIIYGICDVRFREQCWKIILRCRK